MIVTMAINNVDTNSALSLNPIDIVNASTYLHFSTYKNVQKHEKLIY